MPPIDPQEFTLVHKRMKRQYFQNEEPTIHLYQKNAYMNVLAADDSYLAANYYLSTDQKTVLVELIADQPKLGDASYLRRTSNSMGIPQLIREIFGPVSEGGKRCYRLTRHSPHVWMFSADDEIEC